MNEDNELKNRLTDLSRQAARRNTYTYSPFLSLADQDIYARSIRDLAVPGRLYAPNACERKLVIFGSEDELGYAPAPPVSVIRIAPLSEKFAEELTHRDYLGAILNLGIDRSLTGDIVIRGKYAWLYCLDSIAPYICSGLVRVRHTDVSCEIVDGDVPELVPELEELSLNVASERLDAVAAAFTGISRNHVSALFSEKKVYVNSRCGEDPSKPLKEGDVLNIRGFGKAIYDGITGKSKKGRSYVTLRRYK